MSWGEIQSQKKTIEIKNLLNTLEDYLTKKIVKKKDSFIMENRERNNSFKSKNSNLSNKVKSNKALKQMKK